MRLRSIEHKIFWLILPICLAPPLILLLLLGVGSRLTFEQTLGEELSGRAEYLSGAFDRHLSSKIDLVRGMVRGDTPHFKKLAETADQTGISGLIMVGADRPTSPTVILAEPIAKYRRWIEESLYFRPFTQNRLKIPPQGCFQDIEIPVPSRVNPLCLFMHAIESGPGHRIFFLFEASALMDAFRHSLPQDPGSFYVYSSSGFVPCFVDAANPLLAARLRERLNAPHKEQRWFVMREGRHPALIAPADSNYMQHARLVAGQGPVWSILLAYDMENFLSPLASYVWLSVLAALVLVLLTLLGGLVAGRRIVRPLVNLRHQAEELAQGNLNARAAVTSNDEIGELAASFNTMAARLRDSYQDLEDRLEDNQLRVGHINVINEITGAIVQVLSLDSIFDVLVREAGKLARFDAMWIALLDEGGSELRVTHIYPGGLIAVLERGRIPLAGSLHGRVIDSQEAVHAEIGPHDRTEFFETRILRGEGFQSYLIAPLPSRVGVIGTLTVAATAPDAFNAALVPVMGSLAGAVAIGIEQADLFQRISRFATELEHRIDDRTRELERVNQKLIQAEKYFATGRLAGNLAHEINNPLGIMKNYLRLVEKDLKARSSGVPPSGGILSVRDSAPPEGGTPELNPPVEMDLGHLRIINEEVDRIARLVGQMLHLHRPEEVVVRPLDINALLGEILALMEQDLARQNIKIVRELAEDLPQPVGSPDLARQLLINLLRNAQDAMEDGGTLTVRTSAVSEWIGDAARQFLRIRINDTGCGIPPEDLNRIFDPFFTTKPPDKGTGLGLCVSYSIVSMYRGTIDVESKPGSGTTVIVTLPVETAECEAPNAD